MADVAQASTANGTTPSAASPSPPATTGKGPKSNGPRLNKQQQLNKLYALPAPLRTFPLPNLVPHNPLSLFHLIYVWVAQTLNRDTTHLDPLYQGWFSPETRSVHVTDARSIRGLWEQGFHGKGNLSRSEPSWLNRETTRRGTQGRTTAEERTRQRRAERQQTKWERARKEREAIDQKLQEEAEAAKLDLDGSTDAESHATVESEVVAEPQTQATAPVAEIISPVGPLELLSLPNSVAEPVRKLSVMFSKTDNFERQPKRSIYSPPVGPLQLLALPNKLPISPPPSPDHETSYNLINGHTSSSSPTNIDFAQNNIPDHAAFKLQLPGEDNETLGGSETNEDTAEGSTHSEESLDTSASTPQRSALAGAKPRPPLLLAREKSVRFSPMVEKTTFVSSDPPNPEHAEEAVPSVEVTKPAMVEDSLVIKDQEHTQLTLEEAFFLSYGLGALQVFDRETSKQITNKALFKLFRLSSYFPPSTNQTLSPDDSFMMNYVVYHHYRSLGWVPRSGIKFSVDLMLYVRGPVFTHAEYGVIILPSYSDPYWSSTAALRDYVKSKEERTWHWMSCINRVITQVKKTLILTYVDVPPPLDGEVEEKMAVDEVLARYKVREVVLKRWVANRSRD